MPKKISSKKVEKGVDMLKQVGFQSGNEFVQAFYESESHASQALHYQQDANYAPSAILNGWMCNVPKEALSHLNSAVTKAAIEIIIAESTIACKDNTLRLSSSGITVSYLTTDFGLNQIQTTYTKLLPCFSTLLLAVLTAKNKYEQQKGTEKLNKELKASQIVVVIISMCLFFQNQATNAFQLLLELKPQIHCLENEKTQFYPLPALNEEEASVIGTIRVIKKLFISHLELSEEVASGRLQPVVYERSDEFSTFEKFTWILALSMPFHYQLNSMYALCRTHLGTASHGNPSSLEHHHTLLGHSKLDPKKPEYNKAKELVYHSLIACILDCTRIVVRKGSVENLKEWYPSCNEFDEVVEQVVRQFAISAAAEDALKADDEVLTHSILFNCDALLFWEFSEAIRDADVGRMWVVLDFWLYMFQGADCHNYGNKILEMKSQFEYQFSPELQEIAERTWLVNRWGREGHSIPTDLYLEHNNGFLKNMFAALGSNASIEHIQNKSSACVEALRVLMHEVANWFGVAVDSSSDINALCINLKLQKVHVLTPNCVIHTTGQKSQAVQDVLRDGMCVLALHMHKEWAERSAMFEEEEEISDDEDLFNDDKQEIGLNLYDYGTGTTATTLQDGDFEVEEGFTDLNG
ncbi:hypothetical protein BDQ17DRAFT_1439269 [Cyathus striatus]|nr:hypothetical protein BDQ17DRAFT_1439269 [Cyathus striatus]